jgi:hypothetical protein
MIRENPSPKDLRKAHKRFSAEAFKMKKKGIPGFSFLFRMARHVIRIANWLESGCICTVAGCDCYCFAHKETRDKAFREFEQQLYQEWFDIVASVAIFCEKHCIPVQ